MTPPLIDAHDATWHDQPYIDQRRQNLTDTDWTCYYHILREKYLVNDRTYEQVAQEMKDEHSIWRSTQQYQRMFKKWNFEKNLSHKLLKDIASHAVKRKLPLDHIEANVDGISIPRKKLCLALKRNVSLSEISLMNNAASSLAQNQIAAPSTAAAIGNTPLNSLMMVRIALPDPTRKDLISFSPWSQFTEALKAESHRFSTSGERSRSTMSHIFKLAPWTITSIGTENAPRTAPCLNAVQNMDIQSSDVGPSTYTHTPAELLLSPSQLQEQQVLFLEQDRGDHDKSLWEIAQGGSYLAICKTIVHVLQLIQDENLKRSTKETCRRLLSHEVAQVVLSKLKSTDEALWQATCTGILRMSCEAFDLALLRTVTRQGLDINNTIVHVEEDRPLNALLYSMTDTIFKEHYGPPYFDLVESLLKNGADAQRCLCHLKRTSKLTPASVALPDNFHNHNPRICSNTPLNYVSFNNSVLATGIIGILLDYGAVVPHQFNLAAVIARGAELNDVEKVIYCARAASLPVQLLYHTETPELIAQTALEWAICRSDYDIAELLLSQNAGGRRPSASQNLRHTSFQQGQAGNTESGMKNTWLCRSGFSLCRATRDSRTKMVHNLVSAGADVNFCMGDVDKNWVDEGDMLEECSFKADHDLGFSITLETTSNFRAYELTEHGADDLEEFFSALMDPECILACPLHMAIANQDINLVAYFLDKGAKIDSCCGEPCLTIAVRTNAVQIVRILLANGADVNNFRFRYIFEGFTLTPSAEAAVRGHATILELLLKQGADINLRGERYGLTTLQAAILSRDQRCIELCLAHEDVLIDDPGAEETGVDAFAAALLTDNFILFNQLCQRSKIDTYSVPTLIVAIKTQRVHLLTPCDTNVALTDPDILRAVRSNIGTLNYWTVHGLKLNSVVGCESIANMLVRGLSKGLSTWYRASRLDGVFRMIDCLLLQNDFDWRLITNEVVCQLLRQINLYSYSGPTLDFRPASVTICVSLSKTIKERLSHAEEDLLAPYLKLVVGLNKVESLRSILDVLAEAYKITLSKQCLCSQQIIWICVLHGRDEMLKILLKHGLQPASSGSCRIHKLNWGSAFHLATDRGNIAPETLKSLAASVRDVDKISHKYYQEFDWSARRATALTMACDSGSIEKVQILLQYKAKINIPADDSKYGRTALQAACEHGHLEIANLLVIKGADVNAPAGSDHGVTALQAAAMKGYGKICQMLVEQNAEIGAPASPIGGYTAIDGAAKYGRLEILIYLLNNYNGAQPFEDVLESAKRHAAEGYQQAVFMLLAGYERPCRQDR